MLSSSSWGCELKCSERPCIAFWARVILFVRMWVEMPCKLSFIVAAICHPLREDVSWNIWGPACNIRKWVILFVRMWVEMPSANSFFSWVSCHPLREDVSWNINMPQYKSSDGCHPLREDVSWNMPQKEESEERKVILFVRMWVEIFAQDVIVPSGRCHPLREDVSWNLIWNPL